MCNTQLNVTMIRWLKADDEDVMMIKVNRKMNVRISINDGDDDNKGTD